MDIVVNRCGMGPSSGLHPAKVRDFHLNAEQLPGRRPEKYRQPNRNKGGEPPEVEALSHQINGRPNFFKILGGGLSSHLHALMIADPEKMKSFHLP